MIARVTVQDLMDRLKELNPTDVIAHVLWQKDDVKIYAEGMEHNPTGEDGGEVIGHHLTDEECNEVLSRMKHYNDHEYGITWDTLNFHITDVVKERNK